MYAPPPKLAAPAMASNVIQIATANAPRNRIAAVAAADRGRLASDGYLNAIPGAAALIQLRAVPFALTKGPPRSAVAMIAILLR